MRSVLAVCVIAMSLEALAEAPAVRERYIVVLKPKFLFAQPDASAAVRPLDPAALARLGGLVDFTEFDRLVVSLPAAALDAVRRFVNVKYIQRVVIGAPEAASTPARGAAVASGTTAAGTSGGVRGAAARGGGGVVSSSPPPSHATRGLAPRPVLLGESPPPSHATRGPAPLGNPSGTYQYDGAGNIVKIGAESYLYDAAGRLVRAIRAREEAYAYDAFGNLTRATTTENGSTSVSELPASAGSNHLLLAGYTYDAGGNLTSNGSETFAYDALNMMTTRGNGSEVSVYTPGEQRIGIQRGERWYWSVREGSGKVLRQYQSSASVPGEPWLWQEDYVYREGALVGGRRELAEGGTRHFHLDHLGSPRVVTGAGGLRIASHEYAPFGWETSGQNQETANGFDREEPMRFTGHERDTQELDMMHARYYSPVLGRFLSVDPKGRRQPLKEPQAWNRYAYAQNNPLKYFDPNGEETQLALGLQTDRNPIGHIAIIINDRVYSYGTNWSHRSANLQDWGASAKTYLAAQAGERQTELLTLKVSATQEQKLQQYLDAHNPNAPGAPASQLLTNNCATVCQNALVKTSTMPNVPIQQPSGMLIMATAPAVVPQDVVNAATQTGLVTNVQTIGQPPNVRWYESLWNAIKDVIK